MCTVCQSHLGMQAHTKLTLVMQLPEHTHSLACSLGLPCIFSGQYPLPCALIIMHATCMTERFDLWHKAHSISLHDQLQG